MKVYGKTVRIQGSPPIIIIFNKHISLIISTNIYQDLSIFKRKNYIAMNVRIKRDFAQCNILRLGIIKEGTFDAPIGTYTYSHIPNT